MMVMLALMIVALLELLSIHLLTVMIQMHALTIAAVNNQEVVYMLKSIVMITMLVLLIVVVLTLDAIGKL
jgi:hypothetical protein